MLRAIERAPGLRRGSALPPGAAVAAVACLQIVLHWVLLARGTELIVSALTIDDTYYYLGTAWNLKRLGFPSFDGIHPTNGVQFLWFWILAGLAWLLPTKTAFLQAALAVGAVANAGCHGVIWRFARALGEPRLALWMSGLWLLQSLGSVAYSRGLENSVHALVFWVLVWQGTAFLAEVREGRRPRLGILTVVLVLNAWSRVDAGLLSLLVYAFCVAAAWKAAAPVPERRTLAGAIAATGGAAAAACALQLAVFRWMGGSWLPVSALVKGGLEVERWSEVVFRAARLGLPSVIPPLGAAALAALYWLLFVRRADAPAASGGRDAATGPLRAWNRLWLVLLLGLVVHALVVRGGSYWYLAPSHVFWCATLGLLAHRVTAWLGAGRLRALAGVAGPGFLVCAVALTGWQVASRWQTEPNFYALRARVGRWIGENLPPDAILASWNAGQLGYFADRPVVNLDGLANSAEYYRTVLSGEVPLEDYLAAEGVDFIVDRSDGSALMTVFGGEVLDRYPVVRRFRLREDEPRVLLWQVVPPEG
ncbi:MAG TPA: hypothetical protein VLF66_18685 [Thermoanaerobaculia bacterium]|nr:hypothetical protein [Thermoanaerobaculia bacterium]